MFILYITMFINTDMIQFTHHYTTTADCMVAQEQYRDILTKLNESVITGYASECK
jgi:hypothetical protein